MTPYMDGAQQEFQKPRPMWARQDTELQKADDIWACMGTQRDILRSNALS